MPQPPRRLGEIGLLLTSIVTFLLVAEAATRLLGLGDAAPTGYAPVATTIASAVPRNSRGYRDRERTPAKAPGTRRIVCLGDSFAWGSGMHFEDALPQRLERSLNGRDGEAWEVVNLARPGMNTVDQAPQLAAEGLAYDPDLVLLAFCLNDSEDRKVHHARLTADTEARAQRKARKRAGLPRERPLLDRSAFYRLVRRRVLATIENRRRIDGYRAGYAADAPGWIACREALGDMVGRSRARGVPFVLVIFPLFANPMGDDYPFGKVHETVAGAATAAGARVIDLLPAYHDVRWDLLVSNGTQDEHPNEIAHRIAADYVLAKLESDILPSLAPARSAEAASPPPRAGSPRRRIPSGLRSASRRP